MKFNYLVIGAAKCATTTLCRQLGMHPDVFMADCKEVEFFSCHFQRGLAWYESHCKDAGRKVMRGEGSPGYTMKALHPEVVGRIADYDDRAELKLIYIVRNPIQQIESHWMDRRTFQPQTIHRDFNTAVRVNCDLLVDPSNYWRQIGAYREFYSDERILVIFFEDFVSDQRDELRRCFEFLGVPPEARTIDADLHLNSSMGRRLPSPLLLKLRQVPSLRSAYSMLPDVLREPVKRALRLYKADVGRPRWDVRTRRWALDQLEEDTHSFLEFYGKRADFWNLHE